ncbi:MAG TPA: glycoside hydrolase family 3 C-terminal domain-containing protein, partial [Actinotalea sp.]
DVDMVSGAYAAHLADLVRDGTVGIAVVDDAVRRVLETKLRLGLFEQPLTDPDRAAAVQLTREHRSLARRAAAEAVVLLRNDATLPLRFGTPPVLAGGHVHLTGPFATARGELFGTWTLDGHPDDVVSVADALMERLAPAGVAVTVDDARFVDETLVEARAADLVIACVGEHPLRSGEANSVTSLGLPPGQLELLEALARVSARLVVVVVSGRPLALEGLDHLGAALLLVFHPGVEGGHGIVDVLVGDVPASGRLPAALPRSTGQTPVRHDHLPTGRPLDPDGPVGRYRDERDTPRYPFGFGLGYSTVSYGPVELSSSTVAADGSVTAGAVVTNTGGHPVLETVQLYVRDVVAAVSRPVSELRGARRVHLAPGAQERVEFAIDGALLGYRDAQGHPRQEPGAFLIRIAPDSDSGDPARLELLAASDDDHHGPTARTGHAVPSSPKGGRRSAAATEVALDR